MVKRKWVLHVLIWIAVAVLEYSTYPARIFWMDILFLVLRMVLYAGLFYFNALFLYDRLLNRKRFFQGLVFFLLSSGVYAFLFYRVLRFFYFDVFGAELTSMTAKMGIKESAAAQLHRAIITIIIIYYLAVFTGALFYWISRRVRKANATAKRLENEKLLDEYEKVRLQNMFLRSQINPHFLHNTLNFFYAKALPVSAELSEGILTLSNVMRYSLQQEEDEQGMVYLDKEIEHLQNVIAIHQMRFSNNLRIDFTVTGPTEGVKLIPLVFITLLENAFKHGQLSDEKFPLTIRLVVEENAILFHIANRKKTGPREISHGIGIDNIRKRLQYVYKTDYTFEIKDSGDFYSADIKLPRIKK